MNFQNNLPEFIALLKLNNDLEKQSSSLRKKNQSLDDKLVKYRMELSNNLHSLYHQHYISLMYDFVNFSITGIEFVKGFHQTYFIVEESMKDYQNNPDKLKTIAMNSNSDYFSKLLADLSDYCYDFNPNSESFDTYDINETQLRNTIQNIILPQLEKYEKT
jgi:hypothetical protein